MHVGISQKKSKQSKDEVKPGGLYMTLIEQYIVK